jgi:competence protein ComEC
MSRPGAWVLPGLLAGVAIGIATADAGWWAAGLLGGVGALLAAAACALALRRRAAPVLLVGAVVVIGTAVGGTRYGLDAGPSGGAMAAALPTGEMLRVSGVVTDDPTPRGVDQDVVLEAVTVHDGPVAGPIGTRIQVRVPRSAAVRAGDVAALEVTLQVADPADADQRAYRERLRRAGIGALGRAWEVRVIGHREVPVLDGVAILRRWLLDGLLRTVPEPEASLGAGILLGVRAGIDPAIRDAFAVAGLSHVVAISGWNVAIVVALIAAATRRLRERLGPRLPAVLALLTVAGYVALVGASPAVLRAALMAGGLIIARLGGSPAHAASALMAAVTTMLLVTPAALWDVGFQLSALATAGLIVLAGPIEVRLGHWPGWIRVPVALTLAAQAATLPVLLATFEQVSLIAPLANVLVVPLIPAVMAGGAAAAVIGSVSADVPIPVVGDVGAWLAGGSAWLSLHALIASGQAAAAVPLAAVPVSGSAWLTLAWYPLLALITWRLGRRGSDAEPPLESLDTRPTDRTILPEAAAFAPLMERVARPRLLAVGLLVAVACVTAASGPDGRVHLTVLDIGQGDAILIEAPDGATALVDGGVDPDLTLRRMGQAMGFHERQIDLVVLTHPHQDHLGGLSEVLRRFEVGAFADCGCTVETGPHRSLVAAARREPGARLLAARAGERIALGGGAELEILHPSAADVARYRPGDNVHDVMVVVLLRYGQFTALLTGDMEASVEAVLAERGLLQPVDVLKVGHHGSDTSSSVSFLAAIRPSLAVIPVGAANEYGHPHRSVLDNLAGVPGLLVLRTDQEGSIEIMTDGAAYWVTTTSRRLGPFSAQ